LVSGSDVRRIGFDELEARADELDRMVEVSPEIDAFCSSSAWILPAQAAFAPGAAPFVLASPEGFVALMRVDIVAGGRALVPLEAGWGLACPIIGPEPRPLVEHLVDEILADRGWEALLLSGVPVQSRLLSLLRQALHRRFVLGMGPRAGRCIASLEGGVEGFLSRRSAGFRAALRREARAAARAGFEYDWVADLSDPPSAARFLERVLAVERRSWKGREGQGIDRPPSLLFYDRMVRRLAERGQIRAVFVRRGEFDVAYVFGGVLGARYRGLQVSFDADYQAWGPGKLAHLEMIRRLAGEGVSAYDMGQDMDYKHRWAETVAESVTLIALRTGRAPRAAV
jgi:hypothetical protein